MKNDTESQSKGNAHAELIHVRWNPTGGALAAEYWEIKSGLKGFSPVCEHKFQKKAGCQLEKGRKGACRECSVKNYSPLTVKIVKKHLQSTSRKVRFGVYPMIEGNRTAWVALDLDDHVGHKKPKRDLRDLVHVAQALDVPLAAFSSNSGRGFHCYVFFH